MILGKILEPVYKDFSVINDIKQLVPGINTNEFTYHIFNDKGEDMSSYNSLKIIELGYGHYRSIYIPNSIGTWLLSIYHPIYFPWGKTDNIQIFAQDFNSMALLIKRICGLVQENFSMLLKYKDRY